MKKAMERNMSEKQKIVKEIEGMSLYEISELIFGLKQRIRSQEEATQEYLFNLGTEA